MKKSVSTLPGYVANLTHNKVIVFQNWITFVKGTTRVFRSSQPYYNGTDDTPQKFDADAVALLNNYGIKGLISLNKKLLDSTSAAVISAANITYHHLAVKDFEAPTAPELLQGCKSIDSALTKGNVLVFCGFGQGRTGTMITAYDIYKLPKGSATSKLDAIIATSTAETDDQEASLRALYKLLNP